MRKLLLLLGLAALILANEAYAEGTEPQMTVGERMVAEERLQAEQIHINYDHIQTYSTHLRPNFPEEFTFKVAEDHQIKGSLNAYINR